MLLAHALKLSEARSHIAALADGTHTFDASAEYEHVLLELDRIHGDDTPALDTTGLTDDRNVLFELASTAIESLADDHGVDRLQIELVLDMLEAARGKDEP